MTHVSSFELFYGGGFSIFDYNYIFNTCFFIYIFIIFAIIFYIANGNSIIIYFYIRGFRQF
ncbi:hypothetical protein DW219_07270 [Desulfovibrio sp. AM18-2]|nr:hypothetical protein DW219_07270 [Desulfovibrio sp. AM18-2]